MPLKSIELFTGAGGLALGLHRAGFEHAALFERDRFACDTLRHNISRDSVSGIADWDVRECDVTQVSFKEFCGIDLVAGGPPCQPFSLGGKKQGSQDQRDMFPQFVRVVRETMPRSFIMENVFGLLQPRFKDYFRYILLQLQNPSLQRPSRSTVASHFKKLMEESDRSLPEYLVCYCKLNAADYGTPQRRRRVFVVGLKRNRLGSACWQFPSPTHSRQALERSKWNKSYWKKHDMPPQGEGAEGKEDGLAPWVTIRDCFLDLPEPLEGASPLINGHGFRDGAKSYPGHTGSVLDLPSKALKAGVHGVPGGENMLVADDGSLRYFTIREAARLQDFPDSWEFQGAWSEVMRQLGNAVPVGLGAAVAHTVAQVLKGGADGPES